MKYLVRYLLDGDGSVPKFIEEGGYFLSGEEIVGVTVDDAKRYLPKTVEIMTKTQLFDRIKLVAPNDRNGDLKSDQQIMDEVNVFLSSKGLDGYNAPIKKTFSIEEIEKLIDDKIKNKA